MHLLYLASLFSLIVKKNTANSVELEAKITSPLIYNAYLYSEEFARFTCITRNSDNIRWIIDDSTNIDYYVRMIRRIQSRILLDQDGSFLSELLIPAISVNKHIAVIKCEAYNTTGGFQVAESNETAQYNIQGLLEMESNATYSRYNSTHNLVEWLEPPTLNITNVEPDIESYTVCSCPKFNISEHELECTNTSKPQIILPKYYADFFVVVTAWNIVGESNSSAQLMIPKCGNTNDEVRIEGDTFVVEIEFDEDNSTALYISFTPTAGNQKADHNESSIERCLFVYEVTIKRKLNSTELVTPTQLYGLDHLCIRKKDLQRNNLFTIGINRITSTSHLQLHPVDFSTYDLQSVSTSRKGHFLHVICHFARGITAKGCAIQLRSGERVLLQKRLPIIEDCEALQSTPCYANGSIDLSVLPTIGKVVSLLVSHWEPNSFENSVYLIELPIQAANNSSTGLNLTPANTTMIPLIITVAVSGGTLGAVCLIFLSAVVLGVFWKIYKRSGQRLNCQKMPQLHSNEAYSHILRNEAYETAGKPPVSQEDTGPHLYDEIPLPAQAKEPMYAEIGTQYKYCIRN